MRFFLKILKKMSKFKSYNIPLKDLTHNSQMFDFVLNDDFFKRIDSPEVEHGNVKATVDVRQKNQNFTLKISLNGYITVPCDRCLDDMQLQILHNETLLVRFGDSFGEDGDTVIVPESDGCINLAWFFYEMIVVNIPIKHIHPAGECNKTMQQKLKKLTVLSNEDVEDIDNDFDEDESSEDDNEIDPRWEKLKEIDNQ